MGVRGARPFDRLKVSGGKGRGWIPDCAGMGKGLEAEAVLFEADESFFAADDHVVEQFNAEDFACFHELTGDDYVFAAGGGVPLSRDSAADGRIAPAGLRHPSHRTGRATFMAPGSPLAPIHRRSRWEDVEKGKRKCSFESGIMVFTPKTHPEKGAPIRCYHATTPIASP